jgi:hypothetical protein
MEHIRFRLFAIILFAFATATYQKTEPKNKILFSDRGQDVINAIHKMEFYMNKFPQTYMVNCFVSNDGYLYLSNQKIAPINGASINPKVRKDMVFENFKQEEIDEFFNTMTFLMNNDIDGWHKEPSIGRFLYSYKSKNVGSKKDLRLLMIVFQKNDTASVTFKKYFKVLDKKEDIVLFN